MCSACWPAESVWGSPEWPIEFPAGRMVYNDAPLAGEAQCRHCGQWFAYVCSYPVWTSVCHWALIPIEQPLPEYSDGAEPPQCYAEQAARSPEWLSILEDRRGAGRPVVRAAVLRSHTHPVPSFG